MQESPGELASLIARIQARTPARLLVGRAGSSYRTSTQLDLREDHAAAVDAVQAELEEEFVDDLGLFLVGSQASTKAEYLLRPDLGRKLDQAGSKVIHQHCPVGAMLQIVVGDGLSAAAVVAQVPTLLPLLEQGAKGLGWTVGRPFAVRYCRVGIINDVGDLLKADVVVLLIGERPGLATSESLSAYLAYRPQGGQTDAHRNLISNIHAWGTSTREASARILGLAGQMIAAGSSGVGIKEDRHIGRVERG